MKKYLELPPIRAHRLINHGPLVLVSSHDGEGNHNLAPIAWSSPVHITPPRLMVAVGKRHRTYRNIEQTQDFAVIVPHLDQLEMVKACGQSTGEEVDKFAAVGISCFSSPALALKIPDDCVGYFECRLTTSLEIGKVRLFVADVLYAAVDQDAFDGRLLVETPAGKTLHHLGENVFTAPGDLIFQDGTNA